MRRDWRSSPISGKAPTKGQSRVTGRAHTDTGIVPLQSGSSLTRRRASPSCLTANRHRLRLCAVLNHADVDTVGRQPCAVLLSLGQTRLVGDAACQSAVICVYASVDMRVHVHSMLNVWGCRCCPEGGPARSLPLAEWQVPADRDVPRVRRARPGLVLCAGPIRMSSNDTAPKDTGRATQIIASDHAGYLFALP